MLLRNIMKLMPELQGHLPQETGNQAEAGNGNTTGTGNVNTTGNVNQAPTGTGNGNVNTTEAGNGNQTLSEAGNSTEAGTEVIYTPGGPTKGSLGDRVLQRVLENDQRALPIPDDFRVLDPERREGIHPLTLNPTPADAHEATVRAYLQAMGLSLSNAVELNLCYTFKTFVRTGKDSHDDEVVQHIDLPALAYPFYVQGKIISYKLRSCVFKPDEKEFTKDWFQVKQRDGELSVSPFHIDCLWPERLHGQRISRLILTEGEKDCLALYEAGFRHFISVPTGASSDPAVYLKPFIEWLKQVDSIVLCGDTDLQGRRMVQVLKQFFGGHALQVSLPKGCKDIADVLRFHGVEAVREVIQHAHVPDSPAIVTVDQLRASVLDIINGHYDHGFDVGYGPLTDQHFHLDHNGNLIIVSGQPNCGKSSFINDLAMHLIKKHRKRFLFASFEYPNKASHIALMLKLYFGRTQLAKIPRPWLDQALDLVQKHIAHLDLKGILPTPDNILTLADQYLHKHGLDFLVIDPYVFIQHETVSKNESETEQIKRMLTKLQSWGQQHRVSVIIVAHPRKTQTAKGGYTSDLLSPDDISGSAHWRNLADFLFMVRRVETSTERYSELTMYKVRDQQLCTPGSVYYVRTEWGEFIEQPSVEECTNWYLDHNLM